MSYRKLIWVFAFSIAMGFLESSVVIYLRALYYPEGFSFPLKLMDNSIAMVEIAREAATIIMLAGIGYLSGINKTQRFAYFAFSFAIWDIFYYVFLYLCINWPLSIRDWDILFLIPLPWFGPVWAPCLISLFLVIGSLYIIRSIDLGRHLFVSRFTLLTFILGCIICISSFIIEFCTFLYYSPYSLELALVKCPQEFSPTYFNLPLFVLGFALLLSSLYSLIKKNKISL